VLAAVALLLVVRPAAGKRPNTGTAGLVLRTAAAGVTAVLAEVIVVFLVTREAIATAPAGEYSGESGACIAILGVAQLALAVTLALGWARLLGVSPATGRPSAHQTRPWAAIAGIGGMVVGCGAFAGWSLQDGTGPLAAVNARLIAGTPWITNVGAWWPGLFAAMVALTLLAAAAAPGLTSTAEGMVPPPPSASDYAASPVADVS
jgi:hypothetical protein